MTISLLLILVAFILFMLGAAQVPARLSWISLGLAFYMLSILLATSVGKTPVVP